MSSDGWGNEWSLRTVMDWVVAFGLTIAIALLLRATAWVRFSACSRGFWLADRARPWPWGAFGIAALTLGLAIAPGVTELGDLSHALWAAAIQLSSGCIPAAVQCGSRVG